MQQSKITQMTTAPVEKLVTSLALPTIFSMLITTFYNMADTYFVGQMQNTSATGGVGVILPVMAVIQAFGFFFGHGSGNFISRSLGSGNRKESEIMASTGFFSALIFGLLILSIGLLFAPSLVWLLGATETIAPYALDYMRIILLGAPLMMASLVLNNQLRFQGSASYAMIGITVGGLLNIALDPLFIFVFNLGIAGAAWATICGQAVSFTILFFMGRRGENIRIKLKNFKPKWYYIQEMSGGGLPSLLRQGLNSFAVIALNTMARAIGGDAAIAAMSIVSRIMMFAVSTTIGFGQGFQPVCGFNYGAKCYDRVLKAFWFSVKVSACFLTVMAVVAITFAPQLVSLFHTDLTKPDVIPIGAFALRMQAIALPFLSWLFMSNMMLQTIKRTGPASFLAMARQGLFFIPAILTLPHFLGLFGIQIAQACADLVAVICAIPIQVKVLKEFKNLIREQEVKNS